MSDTIDEQTIAELLGRPYCKVIRGKSVDGFLAEAPELPGCITTGATESEALTNLREATTEQPRWEINVVKLL